MVSCGAQGALFFQRQNQKTFVKLDPPLNPFKDIGRSGKEPFVADWNADGRLVFFGDWDYRANSILPAAGRHESAAAK